MMCKFQNAQIFASLKSKRRKPNKRQVFFALLPIGILLSVCAVLYAVYGKELLGLLREPQLFKARLEHFGAWGEAVFVAIRTAQTVFKFIPAEPLEVASGYAFGIFGGLLWCMVGTQLGSLIILFLSKKFGMRFVSLFTDPNAGQSFSFLKNDAHNKLLVFFIYLIPGAPKDLLTYFVPFTDMRISTFMLMTTLARIPSIITSTMCGAYFGEKNYLAAAAVYGATLALSGAGVLVYRKMTAKKNAD